MIRWAVVGEEEARGRWDGWLLEFSDRHFRQCFAWGRHRSSRWKVLHTALFNGPTPMAMGLGFQRRAPLGAASILWMNGGPVFKKNRSAGQDLAALGKYLKGLKEHFASGRTVVRLNSHCAMDLEAQLVLREAGFARPVVAMGTGLTYVADLSKDLEELRDGLEKNWRNQLKAAEKAAPAIAFGRDVPLLKRYLPLHNAMCEKKELRHQRLTLAELERMVADLGEQIVFMVLSAEGKDGCGGALWTFGGKGYFALSAADDWGRRHCLPNLMYWRAIEHLKQAGAESFDLTGIDPKDGWGVYNFKRGLGQDPVEMLGEWEWSKSSWAPSAFNLALWTRKGELT